VHLIKLLWIYYDVYNLWNLRIKKREVCLSLIFVSGNAIYLIFPTPMIQNKSYIFKFSNIICPMCLGCVWLGVNEGWDGVILNVRNEFISFNVEFCYGVSGVPHRYLEVLRLSLISAVDFYYVINKLIILVLGSH
jgi:hypothetical protein